MIMQGRVGDRERWTGLRFPESGRYVVPGALAPVTIDRRRKPWALRGAQRVDAPHRVEPRAESLSR
jgi:hypothetical protein